MHKSVFIFNAKKEILAALRELPLDSVFVGLHALTEESLKSLRSVIGKKTKVYVELGVFAGQDKLDKYPDALPIDSTGKPISVDVFAGVCPTHPGVRKDLLSDVQKALDLGVDGLWLDFIRYPSRWETMQLMDTCYCPRCKKLFKESKMSWTDFKVAQITSMVQAVRNLVNKSGKKFTLGAFLVPWTQKEHKGAILKVLGQDIHEFSKYVDIISPMTYQRIHRRNLFWLKRMIRYYADTLSTPFLPLIQTENSPNYLPDREFKRSLEIVTRPPSMGVITFFLNDLIDRNKKSKLKILKEFYAKHE